MRRSECGTVAIDGRKMKEGRMKEALLNSAIVSDSQEFYIRSEDMSKVKKDTPNTMEYVEAVFATSADYKNDHPPPSVPLDWVAAVVMDQPNVNVAALAALQAKYPQKAMLPCGFHGLDGLIGNLVKQIPVLRLAVSMSKRLTKFCGNQSRVRSVITKIVKKRAHEASIAKGKKVHPRFYRRVRNTRHYPIYLCVKRAYELNHPAAMFFSTSEAVELCGTHKHFATVKAIAVTHRGAFVELCKIFAATLHHVLVILRKLDSTSHNCFPVLMLHLVDLRGTLTDSWVGIRDKYEKVFNQSEDAVNVKDAFAADLRKIVKCTNEVCKPLTNMWAQAAFLLEPRHVVKYLEERAERGMVQLEEDWNPTSSMPASLEDPKLFRTLMHFSKKACINLIKIFWPDTSPAHAQSRQNARRWSSYFFYVLVAKPQWPI